MRITINSIEANILDTNTALESSFIINGFTISDDVKIKQSTLSGRLHYVSNEALSPKVIIDFITSMYEGVENKLILNPE